MRRLGAVLLVTLVGAAGCIRPPSPPTLVPMREVRSASHGREPPPCLVVFLPGYGNAPEDLVARGLPAALDEGDVHADSSVVDAHVGYYLDHTILTRLHEDVIVPAKETGYDRIWLVAISMGALGALGYAAGHPENVSGIILLAPWLGTDGVQDDIRDAGGVERWRASTMGTIPDLRDGFRADLEPVDFFRAVWAFAGSPRRPDGSTVPIYLGYSSYDQWGEGQELLATVLPDRQLLRAYGPHHFTTFGQLYRAFVQTGFLQRSCRVAHPLLPRNRRERESIQPSASAVPSEVDSLP